MRKGPRLQPARQASLSSIGIYLYSKCVRTFSLFLTIGVVVVKALGLDERDGSKYP